MMTKIKKQRWIALFLAVIMFMALLPDSFISAVGVLAQETEESGGISENKAAKDATSESNKNNEKESSGGVQKTENKEIENSDNVPEKKNITLTFNGLDSSENETFSYSLYQGQDEMIVKLDIDTENQAAKSDETGIGVSAEKKDGSIIITLENLSSEKSYTYKLESTGNVKYKTVSEEINLENTNAHITLVQIVEAVNPFAPTLTITYENVGIPYVDKNVSEKKYYYKGRTAFIKSDEGEDKIDIKALRKEVVKKISVTSADNLAPLTLDLSEEAENGAYKVTDETGDIVLKISEWNQTNNSYSIEFIKDGKYSWGDIDYANNAGNKASINFAFIENSTQEDKDFIIDNVGPEANCYINIFPKLNGDKRQEFGYIFDSQKDYTLSLATNLSDNDKSEFCLENVEDKYSGISKVEYYIFQEKQDIQSLKNWTSWNDGTPDITNNTKLSVLQSTDGIFRIYYKLTDNVGNVSYYDGLGFQLDVTPPQIQFFYTLENSSAEQELASNSSIILNKNITVEAVITEPNIDEIVLKINDEESSYETSSKDDKKILTFPLSAENGEDKNYKISLTCTDMVGNSEEAKASVRIDKEFPTISKYKYVSLGKKWEDSNKKEYAFNKDVEVEMAVNDVRFDKSRSKVEIIKNNEPVVSLDTVDNGYGTNDWKWDEKEGNYKNKLEFNTGDRTDDRYIVKVTYTDDAGNKAEYQETIIIDTEPPVVSINFTDGNTPISANNREYYKGRTAVISVSETSSLDMNDFKAAIINGITVKDKDNNKIEISNEENKFYTIQQSADSNDYTIIFTGDGNYEISISYTDKCGNTTAQSAEGKFSIDNAPPKAKGKVLLYKYNNSKEESKEYDLSTTNTDRFSYLSTYFEITGSNGSATKYQSKFILTDIKDELSGVNPNSVKYYLTEDPIGENDRLEDITGWTNQDAKLSNNNTEFTVTLPEAEKSTVYYIYYCLLDYAGNAAYYNGLGIKLDQDAPMISNFIYQTEGKTVSDDPIILENGETINQVYSFSDKVQIDFEVREDNFDEANTKIKIEKYLNNQYTDISDNIGKSKWSSSGYISTTSLSMETEPFQIKEGEINQFKITLETVDKAGRKSTHTEIIRIDKEAPTITIQYQDDLTERAAVHYYKKERTAKITVSKTVYSFVTPENFRKAVIKGISAKDKKNEDIIDAQSLSENITVAAHEEYEVKQGNILIYKMSGWDSDSHSYTVTFNSDAIYGIDIEYVDDAGNSNSGEILYDPRTEDGASFVIDREAPKITINYDNTNMVQKSYYQGERTATISVSDLSFSYSYYYDKEKDWIVPDITAENPFKTVKKPNPSVWMDKGDNTGVFQSTIIYNDDAIYTFKINNPKDICGNELAAEDVEYQNTRGEEISDGESFVVDSSVPVITALYNDDNKSLTDYQDGYYKGIRQSTISIQDLSLYYENYENIKNKENVLLNDYITWNITAENEKGEKLVNNLEAPYYREDSDWSFNNENYQFQCNISYEKDAIYTFDISAVQDICKNVSKEKPAVVTYINKNGQEILDGQFFVIDTALPIVTVIYDDTNKYDNHYYKGQRTATISITDLSFTYAHRKGINKEEIEDVLTDKNKVNWNVKAKNASDKDITVDAVKRENKWSFENGVYTQTIEFNGDAIYDFSLLVGDLCGKITSEKDITYYSEDANSFVIDTINPQITITYQDSKDNKQADNYYKDNRIAEITVSDLSYIYEDKLSGGQGLLTPEKRITDKITSENAKGENISEAFTDTGWTFDNESGVYEKTLCFKEDAIYTFSILKNENGENIPADIYGNEAVISYKNKYNDEDVKDYDFFVISREASNVTVTYKDNEDNKQEEHYYKGEREAYITVSDLSFVFEDQKNNNSENFLSVSDTSKILIEITAENAKGEILKAEDIYSLNDWSFDSENGIYKRTVTFTGDAIYSFNISGQNIYDRKLIDTYQNEQGEKVTDYDSFVIDSAAPKYTVTYNDENKVTDYYENHFYNEKRIATIEVSDLSYVYEDQKRAEDEKKLAAEKNTRIAITTADESGREVEDAYFEEEWHFDKENGIYIKEITFAKDAIYQYTNSAEDIYGRAAEFVYKSEQASAEENAKDIEDWDSFVIDTTAPDVIITYDDGNKGTNSKYENGFYMGDRTANITVSDLSFIYADKYIPENIQTGNLILNEIGIDEKSIYIQPNIEAYSNDTEQAVEKAYTDADLHTFLSTLWSWNDEQNGYQASITFAEEAHYKFTLTGNDICRKEANISYSNTTDANEFVIDKTAPVINITYDDNSPVRTVSQRGYFSRTRTATIVITEGKDTFDAEDAENGIEITARNAAGQEVANAYSISGWTESKASQNGNATTYTATITYQGNANYEFSISYMDKAGRSASAANTNNSVTPYTFTVDRQAPTGTISISGFGSWNRLVDLLTFDRWSNSTVNITASAADEVSSVYSIQYYKTPAFNAMTEQQLRELNDSLWTDYNGAFSVKPDERFTIYLRIEDRSGIVTFISSDGVIIDSTAPTEESIAPEITVNPVQPVNNIYNTSVTVDITVIDPIVNNSYSGLRGIRYEVLNMGIVTQQGQLYTFNYTAGQTLQSQLLQRWNGQIVVDRNLNNSNDVRIVVYAQDNSNNSSSAYTSVQIDVTQPSINITYDNNNGEASFANATYFNADRTATIQITERNFNADDVQITITNTDGVIPSISGWSASSGTGNGDDTVHTATVTYSADGDYTFAVSYADLAGNVNTAPDYGNSTAPEQFTIDKTLPIINVSYDNNSMQNDNYYNAARTATISITEHNFDTGRYNITLTASDDGADKEAPSIGGWSNNGDIHTATVQFADDGYYTMNMSYTDMAGNQAAQFTQHTFYVDQTMPRVAVKGMKNNTANNDETIGFEITCTDTNFDVFTPQLTVTKMVDGSNKTENCVMDQVVSIRNGQTYTVENLDQDGIYSLTCTARDKAGNVFNRVVYLNDADQEESGMDASEGLSFLNFSVNRKGSVYTLEPYADEVAEYYYVREVDDDIVIIETNVDTLKGYIELNGNRLAEGTDYQVEISGGNGEWYVVRYIINKELFAGEGEYKIVVYSEDDAGNIAYSDVKGTNMSFVVDRTAPIVTVSGIEDNGRYQVERQTVTVIPKDDGGKLQKITIEAFDQNGDMLEGFPIVYESEELLALLEENNGELTFELPEGTGMSVRISCEDLAGNEMETMSFDNIVVSTNRLTIILASKTFYYAAAAIVFVLAAVVTGIIVWKKRKKGSGRTTEQE